MARHNGLDIRFRYAQDPNSVNTVTYDNSVTPSCAPHLGQQSQVPFANIPRIDADHVEPEAGVALEADFARHAP
jgi:hypothetical protein